MDPENTPTCGRLGARHKAAMQPELIEFDWRKMDSAPKDCSWVQGMLKDGSVVRMHYAEDLSGEEQPPFRGWFIEKKWGYLGVFPVAWRPYANPRAAEAKQN